MFGKIRLVMLLAILGLTVNANAQTLLPSHGDWNEVSISTGQTVCLTGNVSVKGLITIENHGVLRITTDGKKHNINNGKNGNNLEGMFKVESGGKLIIDGGENRIVIAAGAAFTVDKENDYIVGLENGNKSLKKALIQLSGGSALIMNKVNVKNVWHKQSGPDLDGGLISVEGAAGNVDATLTNCNIWNIRAARGAVLYINNTGDNSSIRLENTIIYQCINTNPSDKSDAGTIVATENAKANLTLTNVKMYYCRSNSNSNNGNGAAISWSAGGGSLTVEGGEYYKNYSEGKGGAMYLNSTSQVKVQNNNNAITWVYHNGSKSDGGGIYIKRGSNHSLEIKLDNNCAGASSGGSTGDVNASGGGIYLNENSKLILQGTSSVLNNTATLGGGIYLNGDNELILQGGVTITGNVATNNGGGIYMGGILKVGEVALTVDKNMCNDADNDVYLPDEKYIEVMNSGFFPKKLGVFTETEPTSTEEDQGENGKVEILRGSNDIMEVIYNGITSGIYDVFDNRGTCNPCLISDKIYLAKKGNKWWGVQREIGEGDLIPDDINSVKRLTAFLWKVNGLGIFAGEGQSDQGLQGKLTADIDMNSYYWESIGTSAKPFTGTFNGNGHTISGLKMDASNESESRAMFGIVKNPEEGEAVIENLVLQDCDFTVPSSSTRIGSTIVRRLESGKMRNCMAIGKIRGQDQAGLLTARMGGLVGNNFGIVENCCCSVKFINAGNNSGGLVGNNDDGGTIRNCYVRLDGENLPKYLLVYINTSGTIKNCYGSERMEIDPTSNSPDFPENCGTYSAVFDEGSYHKYGSHDCKVSTTGNPLECELNAWIDAQADKTNYVKWSRPTTTDINGDYPLLRFEFEGKDYNAVLEDESGNLHYGNFNGLIDTYDEDGTTIWLYGGQKNMKGNGNAQIYVGEDVGLTHAEGATINATVGITLDNSAGTGGANPTQGGTDAIDWHFFSTSLSNAPLGIAYVNSDGDEDETHYGMYATDLPQYQHTGEGYFPDTDFDGKDYYKDWDFYAYYEPEYQWVNYKRNSNSHWNVDTGEPLLYTNEATLVPGKGYLVALADPDGTLLQCEGELNDGEIRRPLTCGGPHRRGFNLLGNPYQSYLDFEEFAKGNSQTIWNTTISSDYSREDPDLTRPGYIIMDEDQRGYIFYAYGASVNDYTAPRYLHPHQGFMVVTQNAGEAVFNNDMREVNANGSTFRSEPQADYPLVDLFCYDEDGNRDLTVVELGRPDKGGMAKVDGLSRGKGIIYTHYGDEDYCIAFTEPGLSSVAVRFQAFEDAAFTMKWVTQNGAFSYLHLIDNKMGTDVDCLATDEYRFTASPDDYVSRFKLVFDYTGIGEDAGTAPAETFAFVSGGEMVVNGSGRLEIIDLCGRVIETVDVSGQQSAVAKPALASGIYLLRLTDGDSVKVQKIVLGE